MKLKRDEMVRVLVSFIKVVRIMVSFSNYLKYIITDKLNYSKILHNSYD